MTLGAAPRLLLAAGLCAAAGCTHTMSLGDCRELFTEFAVDAQAARRVLPAGYEPRLRPDGQATLLIMIQDCREGVLDGIVFARPVRWSHVWLEIAGPEETGTALAGTSRSLPTISYYNLPHQTDRALVNAALHVAGIDSQAVEEITLGGAPGAPREGHVTTGSPRQGYRWTERARLWPSPEVVTGRRRFLRECEGGARRTEGVVVCHSSFLGESVVTLRADSESIVGRLGLGETLVGAGRIVEMKYCRAEIRVTYN